MIAFLTPGVGWTDPLATIQMIKASRSSASRGIIDHMLSMGLFVVMLIEFLLIAQAATSTFFLLMMISLVDTIGGFAITARAARRDVAIEEAMVPADRG